MLGHQRCSHDRLLPYRKHHSLFQFKSKSLPCTVVTQANAADSLKPGREEAGPQHPDQGRNDNYAESTEGICASRGA